MPKTTNPKKNKVEDETTLQVLPPPPVQVDETDIHIMSCAEIIKDCDASEVKLYVASARYAVREMALHLAKSWPEILRISRRLHEEEEKPRGKVSMGLEMDFTNPAMLSAKFKFNVAPFKLKYTSTAEEDLSQMVLDFKSGSIQFTDPISVEQDDEGGFGDE